VKTTYTAHSQLAHATVWNGSNRRRPDRAPGPVEDPDATPRSSACTLPGRAAAKSGFCRPGTS